MKKTLYIAFATILIFILAPTVELLAQREEFGKKKIGRERISRDDRATRDGDARKAGPPGPGGGGEGDPIPVNGGLLLLLGMSATYFLVRRNEQKSK